MVQHRLIKSNNKKKYSALCWLINGAGTIGGKSGVCFSWDKADPRMDTCAGKNVQQTSEASCDSHASFSQARDQHQ